MKLQRNYPYIKRKYTFILNNHKMNEHKCTEQLYRWSYHKTPKGQYLILLLKILDTLR